jgi:mannose-6-phosphate isomerase-like protein (cupin superfamily)
MGDWDSVAPGDRVRNVLTGEEITFLKTSADPEAQAVETDVAFRPLGVPGGMAHRHRPAERFEVRSGALLALIAGRVPFLAREGDVIEVPAGRWHMVVALRPSRALVSVRPAMRFDQLLACSAAVGSGDLHPHTLRRLNALLHEHDCMPRFPAS